MPNYNFQLDLLVSKKTEREVGKLLESLGATILEYRDDNKYDIKFKTSKRIYTVEVKEDFTCEKTGNIGIEYHCRGKESGISVSKSDYYIYKVHEPSGKINFYMMKTDHIKKLIKEKVYHRTVNGGDLNSNSLNYLFYLEDIKNISKLI